MDGGRRLLRSITGFGWTPSVLANAPSREAADRVAAVQKLPMMVRPRERRAPASGMVAQLIRVAQRPLVNLLLALTVVGGAGVYGAVSGGQYAAFVAANGSIPDFLARSAGFGIAAVIISADNGINDADVLKISGITSTNSLMFLDAADVRSRLKSVPLIKEASVRKLFPDRLLIDVEERQPYGLWQQDGKVSVISADGVAMDEMRDDRFAELPFVVGEGANTRIAEFSALLNAAGEMRPKIRAGVLVSGRRWNLKMVNGVDVRLPEIAPEKAVAALALLDHDARVLDKDVLWLDLRQPGRMIARLGAEAATARAEWMAARKHKGSAT